MERGHSLPSPIPDDAEAFKGWPCLENDRCQQVAVIQERHGVPSKNYACSMILTTFVVLMLWYC